MGVETDIPANGTYTFSNLKSATGIASNSLFSQGPSGVSSVAFGDFVCKGMGRPYDDSLGSSVPPSNADPANWKRKLVPVTVNGSSSDAQGSYDTQDPPFYSFDNIGELSAAGAGDTFVIRVTFHTVDLGEYFYEQIFDGPGFAETQSSIATLQSVTEVTDGSGNTIGADLEYQMTDFGGSLRIAWTWEDVINSNGTNYGTATTDRDGDSLPEDGGLVFRTTEVDEGTPLLTEWYWQVENTGAGYNIDFNITANNSYSEANVVYDPADQIDGQFKLARDKTDFDNSNFYGSDTSPQFNDTSYPTSQQSQVPENIAEGGRFEYYLQLEDQSGTVRDAVTLRLSEAQGISLPASGNTKCYQISGPTSRTEGDRNNLYVMDDATEITC